MSGVCCVFKKFGSSALLSGLAGDLGSPGYTPVAIQSSVGFGGTNRNDDVLAVQRLLNKVRAKIGKPLVPLDEDGWIGPKTVAAIREFQQSQLGFNDGRVDPFQKTINKLNELAAGQDGSPPVSPPPSGTSPPSPSPSQPIVKMTPVQAALEATPRAMQWALSAQTHLVLLKSGLRRTALGPPVNAELFAIANVHFHLDRNWQLVELNLAQIIEVFGRIMTMLRNPDRFYREGPMVKLGEVESWWADAPVGGFHLSAPNNTFTFRPRYPDTGPNCRAAILLHEGAHFCGLVGQIGHFAQEFPPPDGTPQGGPRNYAQLLTHEAMRNASSYAAFAIHAATGVDHRYGLHRPEE